MLQKDTPMNYDWYPRHIKCMGYKNIPYFKACFAVADFIPSQWITHKV